MNTWNALRAETSRVLTKLGADAPDREAAWILEDASGLTALELHTQSDSRAPARVVATVQRMLEQRAAGMPIQYVLGHWAFRGLDLLVDTRVLIPRPETEWVVECALHALEPLGIPRGKRNQWTGTTTEHHIVDLGTGSGAIALAMAAELPHAQVWATEVSTDALTVARANIAGTGATRVRLTEGSWFGALPDELHGTVACVISNPPYIGASEWELLDHSVRDFEPLTALVGGPDGFEAIAEIISEAPEWLTPDGVLVIELASQQDERAQRAARDAGFTRTVIAPDLTGRARALIAHMSDTGDPRNSNE
ncbi:MAG: peptide chain release factor N(5)-glutamine methyltransferase [Acidimicrobiia bacterium]